MAKLKLTMACDKYDYLQPLRDGQVEVEGIDLNLMTVESGIRHERMFRYGEYDACEFSMSSYLVARGRDVDWLQAIPFFPRRMWGHKFCFIRSGSGIKKPADLKGGRIGWRKQETASFWMPHARGVHREKSKHISGALRMAQAPTAPVSSVVTKSLAPTARS